MGKFEDLLRLNNHLPPGEQQRLAREQFPSVAATTHMSMWSPGESFPTNGNRILIGVATYSLYDLDLLDALDSQLLGNDAVQLFEVSSCSTMDDFEKFIPGIGKVFQTPVIGFWKDGELIYHAQGALARRWARDRYGLTLTMPS